MRIFTALLCFLSLTVAQASTITKPTESLSLREPSVSEKVVMLFASEAAMSAYTYNFATYRHDFQETSEYFSPTGWRSFMNALKASGNLNKVIEKKLVVKAVPTDTPIVVHQGVTDGIYTWQVQIPMLVVYHGQRKSGKQNVVVNMHIRRTSKFIGRDNIAIDDFIAQTRTEKNTA